MQKGFSGREKGESSGLWIWRHTVWEEDVTVKKNETECERWWSSGGVLLIF